MTEKQKTIKKPASFSGVGLHTGQITTVTFKPSGPDTGLTFVRSDLPGQPRIPVYVDNVQIEDVLLQTALGKGEHQIKTVEHVLAAVAGLGIDNLDIEVNAGEPPVGDGSARPFIDTLLEGGIQELDAPRRFIEVHEPIWLVEDGREMAAIPSNRLEVTWKIEYDHPAVGIRSASFWITPETFRDKIAPARTFCFLKDIEAIRQAGLIQGGSLENAIVIGDDSVLNPGDLRFEDEIVRHKIVDVLGDLTLLGAPIKAHIVGVRSGHAFNVKFVRKILECIGRTTLQGGFELPMNVERLQQYLPHRPPFLMVDRIVELDLVKKRSVGIKNVTVDEWFFQGHFPQKAIMPGVLVIEAMAQVAGIVLYSQEEYRGKLAYLASIENAKLRRPVVPGDQLRLEAVVTKSKLKTFKVQARATVNGLIAGEACFVFFVTDQEAL